MARTVADRERDYRALDMARRGFTQRQIAAELGWATHKSAGDAVKRALREINNLDADEVVKLFRDRLDDYRRQAWRVLSRKHYVVSASGALVRDPDSGDPLVDDGPVLQALDRLLRYDIEERKMLGTDAPTKHRVDVITEDAVDAELRELAEKHARMEAEGITLANADSGAA